MKRWAACWLVGAAVGVSGVQAGPGRRPAQPPAPGPVRPAPAVIAAWEQAGAVFGWTSVDPQGDWRFDNDEPPAGALPAFRLRWLPAGGLR